MWAVQTAEQDRSTEAQGLRSLLPGGAVRPGTTVSTCGDLPLLLAMAAESARTVGAERGGAWAAVGLPRLGALAAADTGLDLGVGMWVDQPGRRWPEVVATALEAVPVVLLGLPAPLRAAGRGTVPERTVRRLAALSRRSGSVLLVAGPWPGAELRLRVSQAAWEGVSSDGYGLLRGRRTRVTATGRGVPGAERGVELWLPGPHGTAEADVTRTEDGSDQTEGQSGRSVQSEGVAVAAARRGPLRAVR